MPEALITLVAQGKVSHNDDTPTCGAQARGASSARRRCDGKPSKSLRPGSRKAAEPTPDPIFPTRRGTKLSRDALEHLVRRHTLAAAKSCPSLSGKRVSPHVLRHSTANRALLARHLRRQGYMVSLAENGRQALKKLRARSFDLVLLDVIMPEMGGYQVLEAMKGDPLYRHIPVIMISALDDLEMLARCIEKGAEDYLSKPFDAVLLRARIGSSLEKKWLHDQEERNLRALVESQKRLTAELAEAAT